MPPVRCSVSRFQCYPAEQPAEELEKTDIPHKVIQAIRQDVSTIKELSKPLRLAAIGAYEQSMHTVFLAIAGAGLLAFVALFFIEEKDLPGRSLLLRRCSRPCPALSRSSHKQPIVYFVSITIVSNASITSPSL